MGVLTRSMLLSAAACTGLASSAALADDYNFRDWIGANGFTNNSGTALWQGRTGSRTGTLMTPSTSNWSSPSLSFGTPLIGPLTIPGSDNGAAGPATFNGTWVHPGSGVPAYLVFSPQSALLVGGMTIRSELILNGLSGNGVRISVEAYIGGVTTSLGTITLTGTNDRTDVFALPTPVIMQPGDSLSMVVDDNGSYLFDHVNFNAVVTVPGPGTGVAMLAVVGMGLGQRRRVVA